MTKQTYTNPIPTNIGNTQTQSLNAQARNVRPTYLPRVSSLNNTFHVPASHGPKDIGSQSKFTRPLQPFPLLFLQPSFSSMRKQRYTNNKQHSSGCDGGLITYLADNEDSGTQGGLEVIPTRRGPGRQKCKAFLGGRAGHSAGYVTCFLLLSAG